MALVFYDSPEAPVECALEISRAFAGVNLPLRMGVHSGPVSGVIDANGRASVAGAGINIAQRVMDCGDAGHILSLQACGRRFGPVRTLAPALARAWRVRGETRQASELGQSLHERNRKPGSARQIAVRADGCDNHGNRGCRHQTSARTLVVDCRGSTSCSWNCWRISFFARPHNSGVDRSLPSIPEKSIAVLPFENLSGDKANAYFADGIQDEILTRFSQDRRSEGYLAHFDPEL